MFVGAFSGVTIAVAVVTFIITAAAMFVCVKREIISSDKHPEPSQTSTDINNTELNTLTTTESEKVTSQLFQLIPSDYDKASAMSGITDQCHSYESLQPSENTNIYSTLYLP